MEYMLRVIDKSNSNCLMRAESDDEEELCRVAENLLPHLVVGAQIVLTKGADK